MIDDDAQQRMLDLERKARGTAYEARHDEFVRRLARESQPISIKRAYLKAGVMFVLTVGFVLGWHLHTLTDWLAEPAPPLVSPELDAR